MAENENSKPNVYMCVRKGWGQKRKKWWKMRAIVVIVCDVAAAAVLAHQRWSKQSSESWSDFQRFGSNIEIHWISCAEAKMGFPVRTMTTTAKLKICVTFQKHDHQSTPICNLRIYYIRPFVRNGYCRIVAYILDNACFLFRRIFTKCDELSGFFCIRETTGHFSKKYFRKIKNSCLLSNMNQFVIATIVADCHDVITSSPRRITCSVTLSQLFFFAFSDDFARNRNYKQFCLAILLLHYYYLQ